MLGQHSSIDVTPQQRKVLNLAARGLSGPEIGAELNISSQTVRHHLQSARSKLNAKNTVQAVAIALNQHIVTLEEEICQK